MPSFEKVGRYGVIEKIGRGSFSAVYLCEDPADGRPVAVKVCTAEDKDLLERFAREAEIAGRLDHPNIVRVYESGISAEKTGPSRW